MVRPEQTDSPLRVVQQRRRYHGGSQQVEGSRDTGPPAGPLPTHTAAAGEPARIHKRSVRSRKNRQDYGVSKNSLVTFHLDGPPIHYQIVKKKKKNY